MSQSNDDAYVYPTDDEYDHPMHDVPQFIQRPLPKQEDVKRHVSWTARWIIAFILMQLTVTAFAAACTWNMLYAMNDKLDRLQPQQEANVDILLD